MSRLILQIFQQKTDASHTSKISVPDVLRFLYIYYSPQNLPRRNLYQILDSRVHENKSEVECTFRLELRHFYWSFFFYNSQHNIISFPCKNRNFYWRDQIKIFSQFLSFCLSNTILQPDIFHSSRSFSTVTLHHNKFFLHFWPFSATSPSVKLSIQTIFQTTLVFSEFPIQSVLFFLGWSSSNFQYGTFSLVFEWTFNSAVFKFSKNSFHSTLLFAIFLCNHTFAIFRLVSLLWMW